MSIILFIFVIVFSQCDGKTVVPQIDPSVYEMVFQSCLERTGYMPLDNNSFFRVLEVPELSRMYLPCSLCGESNEESPWYWVWRPRSSNISGEQEVKLGLAVDLHANRIFMFPNHTLVVQNVTADDTGIYYCRSLMGEDSKEFQFSIDVIFPEVPLIEEKRMPWFDYQNKVIASTNKGIYLCSDDVVREILQKIHVKVQSEWGPWLPCDGCRGLRKRYAKCRIYPSLVSPLTDLDHLDSTQLYLYHSEHPSCHSIRLSIDVPHISAMVKRIPNLLRSQACYASCSEETREHAKYESKIQFQAGSSASFICPGADLEKKILWKRDGLIMKPVKAFKEKSKKRKWLRILMGAFKRRTKTGQVFVDRFNVLQLWNVGDDDSAVYECFINNQLVKTFHITVVVGEHVAKQRYYQYIMLSVYTSLVSAVIVLLGIARAFFKRGEFPTVEEIEAAERRRRALRDGVPLPEEDSGTEVQQSTEDSTLSKRRFSLIVSRPSKHEEYESRDGNSSIQKKRGWHKENHNPSEKEPLIH